MTDTYTAAEIALARDAFVKGHLCGCGFRPHPDPAVPKLSQQDHAKHEAIRHYPDPAPPRVPTDEDRGKRVAVIVYLELDGPASEVEGTLLAVDRRGEYHVRTDDNEIVSGKKAELIDPPDEANSEQKMQDAVSAVLGEPAGKVRQPRFGSATPPPADEQQPVWRDATEADDGFVGEIELFGDDAREIYTGTLVYRQDDTWPWSVIREGEVTDDVSDSCARILANPVDAGEGKG
ncbi:MAG: hypothetical protein AAGI54_08170 [Planctomycetota bacterium]